MWRVTWIVTMLAVCGFWHQPAVAQEGNPEVPMTIDAGAIMYIDAYDKNTNRFGLASKGEECTGIFMATPEALAEAVNKLDYQSISADPKSVIGKVVRLTGPLVGANSYWEGGGRAEKACGCTDVQKCLGDIWDQ